MTTVAIDVPTQAPPQGRGVPRWFRVNLWLHRWTGLLAAPFFLVLCLTGSILIFHEEIDYALGTVPGVERPAGTREKPLAELVQAARAQAPGGKVMYVGMDPDAPGRVMVGMGPAGVTGLEDTRPVFVNAYTGASAPPVAPRSTLTGFVLELHAQWFAGLPGQLFGGLVALLTLVSLVTGVVVYAPHVRRLAFGMIRRERGARIAQLDLHNLVGVVVLGWATVVTVTGALLALATLLLAVWQSSELKEMTRADATDRPAAAAFVSPDRALAAAARARPDRRAQFLFYPGTDFSGPGHYTALLYGTKSYNERQFDVATIDAATGEVADVRALPSYLQAVVISEPLHFGDYGGLPLKLLWLASAWGTLFIAGNGAWLWAKRRPGRRRARAAAEPRS